MPKFFLSLILVFAINSQAAGPRCFDLFAENEVTTAKKSVVFYAEALDALNTKYNQFLFTENLGETLNPQLDEAGLPERTLARYRAYRLRKVLKQIYAFDQFANDNASRTEDRYALEKLAAKLEQLSFLNDDSVTKEMSFFEKITYREAQHSLLAGGLAKFLFDGEPKPTRTRFKKIMGLILVPFKDIYFRWAFALTRMPKLNGAVIPYEVIEKIVIDGYDNNKDLLEPYLRQTRFKAAFNVFSTSYNWILAGSVLIGAGTLAYTTYHHVYLPGIEHAVEMLKPMLTNANHMANIDFGQFRFDETLKNVVQAFQSKYHRLPNADELQMLQALVKAKLT